MLRFIARPLPSFDDIIVGGSCNRIHHSLSTPSRCLHLKTSNSPAHLSKQRFTISLRLRLPLSVPAALMSTSSNSTTDYSVAWITGNARSHRSDPLRLVVVAISLLALFVTWRSWLFAPTSIASDPHMYSVAWVTAPSKDVAVRLAHGLVDKKLAACVNIKTDVTSVYVWENKVNEDQEALMMVKTRTSLVEDVIAFVRKNHPYENPEVIFAPIVAGSQPYLDWIGQNTHTHSE